jgi:phasin family protein
MFPYNSSNAALQHIEPEQLVSRPPTSKELTMFVNADQVTATAKSNLETLQGLSTKSYAGFEKLIELNIAATKAVISETFGHAQAVLSAKDVQQAISLQTSAVAPMAEKTVAYGRHVYGIAIETGAEFTKTFEVKAAEAQKSFNQVIENVAKNAPAGSESAVAVVKSALASSQSAIESAQSAAKQALAMAESNIAAVTEQALSAAASVGKKA